MIFYKGFSSYGSASRRRNNDEPVIYTDKQWRIDTLPAPTRSKPIGKIKQPIWPVKWVAKMEMLFEMLGTYAKIDEKNHGSRFSLLELD